MQENIFIVHCERVPRRQYYYLRFPINDQLIQRIKNLPQDTRKWNASVMCWEVSTLSLFNLIKRYKGSTKIKFEFGNEKSRDIFISHIKKIVFKEEEKRKFITDLNIKKEHWVKYKEELETTYADYSEKAHSFLKDEIKLYPHQIVAAMFMNATRSTLISHEMGTGKTLSSILYAEMNGFEKVFVITPNSLKFNYYDEVKKFTNSTAHIINWRGNDCGIEEAKYIIVNYDYFNPNTKSGKFLTKWKKLGIDVIDCVICDECLTYDTMILTDIGEIKIGEIVENALDVNIMSYNHKLKKTELKPISRYLYNGRKKTIRVKLSNGVSIECTPDHEFYSLTNKKYKPIEAFEIGEKIYDYETKKTEEKNRNTGNIWVESIEILESRNRSEYRRSGDEGKRVFDLEIKDNHNFFANGILVSNSHKIKNTKANTYKNFKSTFTKDIFRNGNISKIFLSGTPAPNRAYELYTVLNQISPTDFATKNYFQEYYCGMTYDYENGWGYTANTLEQKFEELYHKIAPFTHRKRKVDVLTDLPDKTYQRILLELTDKEQKIYDDIEAGVANEFDENPNGNPLTTMIRLRQYLAQVKVKHVKELIENINDNGEKVVVVDYFKDSLYELKKIMGENSELHTGDQDVETRSNIVRKFQDNDSSLMNFLGSIQTCNYGLTLTAASKLFIMTLPYSVGEYDQVSDRLHRIGQKSAVNIYVLVFPDTIDDYVFSAIEDKRKEVMKVIDNEDYESNVDESVISEVIKKIKEKHGK